MKDAIKNIINTKPTPRVTDIEISKITTESYFLNNNFWLIEGTPTVISEVDNSGYFKVRMNGLTIISNDYFIEIQEYIKNLEERLKI